MELDVCWGLLGLGDRPLTLRLPSPGRTRAQRRHVVAGVVGAFARRGLVEPGPAGPCRQPGPGRPVGAVAGALRLLARPDHQVDLRATGPAGPVTVIGAAGGGCAVRLVRAGADVALRPVRPSALAASVVAVLDRDRPVRAGTGRPVNIPAEVFDAAQAATADRKLWTMADELVALGISRPDAASWVRMCTGIRAVAQLGTTRWADGTPRPGPWAVGVQRTSRATSFSCAGVGWSPSARSPGRGWWSWSTSCSGRPDQT
ncbi:MAG TPA: ESX secretion-associated protein EspG [Pseudonocardia sp.]